MLANVTPGEGMEGETGKDVENPWGKVIMKNLGGLLDIQVEDVLSHEVPPRLHES